MFQIVLANGWAIAKGMGYFLGSVVCINFASMVLCKNAADAFKEGIKIIRK